MITTIVPTYRRPELLRRAVLSALAQEGVSLQVCVYDNASGDSTRAVIAELANEDPRVKYFCHQENIGGMANFQFGLKSVSTPFFSFLSDDDVLLPGFYSEAAASLENFPEAAFWCGVTALMTPTGVLHTARVADWPREGVYRPPDGLLQMIKGSMPCWTGALFRKSVMDSIGPLNEQLQGPSDIEYTLRAAVRNSFVISKRASAIFLLNPESFSETSPFESFWPGWKGMIESIGSTDELDARSASAVHEGLRSNARRMLLRRGAAALAKRDYEFSNKASAVLSEDFGATGRSMLLSVLGKVCSEWKFAQLFYSWAYRRAENLTLKSRRSLQQRYGYFSKYL